MRYALTDRQQDLLRFITGHLEQTGRHPSVKTMMAGIGTRSHSYIYEALDALEDHGLVIRDESCAARVFPRGC